jgi:hypothetical protein
MKTSSRDYRNRPQKNPVLAGVFLSHSKGDLCGIEIEKIGAEDRDTP